MNSNTPYLPGVSVNFSLSKNWRQNSTFSPRTTCSSKSSLIPSQTLPLNLARLHRPACPCANLNTSYDTRTALIFPPFFFRYQAEVEYGILRRPATRCPLPHVQPLRYINAIAHAHHDSRLDQNIMLEEPVISQKNAPGSAGFFQGQCLDQKSNHKP